MPDDLLEQEPETQDPPEDALSPAAIAAIPKPRPAPVNAFDAALRPQPVEGESSAAFGTRLGKLKTLGLMADQPVASDEERQQNVAAAEESRQKLVGQQTKEFDQSERQRVSDERRAKAQELRDQKASEAGYVKMMKDAGAVTEMGDDGKETVKSHPVTGQPVYKPAIVSDVHAHPDHGEPVVDVRDTEGNITKQNADKLGLVHVDPRTGARYTRQNGQVMDWGFDQPTIERNAKRDARDVLLNASQLQERDIQDARAELAMPGGLQEEHANARAPIVSAQNSLKAAQRALAAEIKKDVDSLPPGRTELREKLLAKINDPVKSPNAKAVQTAQKALDDLMPEYEPVRQRYKDAHAAIQAQVRARNDTLRKAEAIATDIIFGRVAMHNGGADQVADPVGTAAAKMIANAKQARMAAAMPEDGMQAPDTEAVKAHTETVTGLSEKLAKFDRTKSTLNAVANAASSANSTGSEAALKKAVFAHTEAADDLHKATRDPSQWAVDPESGVGAADMAREGAGAQASGLSAKAGVVNALGAAKAAGIAKVNGQPVEDVIKQLQAVPGYTLGVGLGLAGQAAMTGTVGPQGMPIGFESEAETARRKMPFRPQYPVQPPNAEEAVALAARMPVIENELGGLGWRHHPTQGWIYRNPSGEIPMSYETERASELREEYDQIQRNPHVPKPSAPLPVQFVGSAMAGLMTGASGVADYARRATAIFRAVPDDRRPEVNTLQRQSHELFRKATFEPQNSESYLALRKQWEAIESRITEIRAPRAGSMAEAIGKQAQTAQTLSGTGEESKNWKESLARAAGQVAPAIPLGMAEGMAWAVGQSSAEAGDAAEARARASGETDVGALAGIRAEAADRAFVKSAAMMGVLGAVGTKMAAAGVKAAGPAAGTLKRVAAGAAAGTAGNVLAAGAVQKAFGDSPEPTWSDVMWGLLMGWHSGKNGPMRSGGYPGGEPAGRGGPDPSGPSFGSQKEYNAHMDAAAAGGDIQAGTEGFRGGDNEMFRQWFKGTAGDAKRRAFAQDIFGNPAARAAAEAVQSGFNAPREPEEEPIKAQHPVVEAKTRADEAAQRLDAAKTKGDVVETAKAQDDVLAAGQAADHAVISGLKPINPKTEQAVSGIMRMTRTAVQTAVQENPHLGVAGVEIGRQMRDLYMTGAQQDAARQILARDPVFAGQPALAEAHINQRVGVAVAKDLASIATGGNENVSPAKLAALDRLGYVTLAENSLMVTADGVTLLPKGTRDAIAKTPGSFRVNLSTAPSLSADDHQQGLDAVASAVGGKPAGNEVGNESVSSVQTGNELETSGEKTLASGAEDDQISQQSQGGVARLTQRTHNPQTEGSNPSPATNQAGGAGASPAEFAGSRSVKKHPESPAAEEQKPALSEASQPIESDNRGHMELEEGPKDLILRGNGRESAGVGDRIEIMRAEKWESADKPTAVMYGGRQATIVGMKGAPGGMMSPVLSFDDGDSVVADGAHDKSNMRLVSAETPKVVGTAAVAFGLSSGSLGIPREQMPQIKSEHRGALTNFFKARGVDWKNEEVLPGKLKPTQREYIPAKVEKARQFEEPNRRILVSADNHVLDGHHQWLAALHDHPAEPMPIIRLDAPIRDLIRDVAEFPSAGMEKEPDALPKVGETVQHPKHGAVRVDAVVANAAGTGHTIAWSNKGRKLTGLLPLDQLTVPQAAVPSTPGTSTETRARMPEEKPVPSGKPSSASSPAAQGAAKSSGAASVPTEKAGESKAASAQESATVAAEQAPKTFRVKRGPRDDFGGEGTPVAAFVINDLGGMMSRSAARRRGLLPRHADQWEAAPRWQDPSHNKIYKPNSENTPSTVASRLHDAGLLPDGDVDTLWTALAKESQSAKKVKGEEREFARRVEEWKRFNAASGSQKPGTQMIRPEDGLVVKGETVTVGTEQMKVTHADADLVVLEDGTKFGVQEVTNEDVVWGVVEDGSLTAGEPRSKEEYQGHHRPNSEGPRLFDLTEGGQVLADVYEHPEWYTGQPGETWMRQTAQIIRSMRGLPDAEVTVYRASPRKALNSGDWISLSKQYAKQHGMADDPSEDLPVHSFTVKARDVRWSMDELGEFGYFPEDGASLTAGRPRFDPDQRELGGEVQTAGMELFSGMGSGERGTRSEAPAQKPTVSETPAVRESFSSSAAELGTDARAIADGAKGAAPLPMLRGLEEDPAVLGKLGVRMIEGLDKLRARLNADIYQRNHEMQSEFAMPGPAAAPMLNALNAKIARDAGIAAQVLGKLAEIQGQQGTLFAATPSPEKAGPFYSQLTRTVQALPQETMTVQQARAAIEKGAKKDEIAMSGILSDPLSPLYAPTKMDQQVPFGKPFPRDFDHNSARKVTKAELTGYALERQARVEDVVLGENAATEAWMVKDSATHEKFATEHEAEAAKEEWVDTLVSQHEYRNPDASNWEVQSDDDGSAVVSYRGYRRDVVESGFANEEEAQEHIDDAIDRRKEEEKEVREEAEEEVRVTQIEDESPDATHFAGYQIPGADEGSYREMFVTWPKETEEQREKLGQNLLGSIRSGEMTEKEAYAHFDSVKGREWTDGHNQYADIANPIVRIRRNLRTDAAGRKTYFIEEMQGPGKGEQEKMPPELRKRIYEIGMKRALRDAVDEGAAAIAWTTGEQQAERYDLSKQVHKITFNKSPTTKEPGKDVYVAVHRNDAGDIAVKGQYSWKELTDLVGKDVAEKIENGGQYGSLEGLDLKVGGEGLKRVYDQMLPAIANDLGRKFGVRVGNSILKESADLKNQDWKYEGPSRTQEQVDQMLALAKRSGRDLYDNPLTGQRHESIINRTDNSNGLREMSRAMKAGMKFEQAVIEFGNGSIARLLGGEIQIIKPDTSVHSLAIPEALRAQQAGGNALFAQQPASTPNPTLRTPHSDEQAPTAPESQPGTPRGGAETIAGVAPRPGSRPAVSDSAAAARPEGARGAEGTGRGVAHTADSARALVARVMPAGLRHAEGPDGPGGMSVDTETLIAEVNPETLAKNMNSIASNRGGDPEGWVRAIAFEEDSHVRFVAMTGAGGWKAVGRAIWKAALPADRAVMQEIARRQKMSQADAHLGAELIARADMARHGVTMPEQASGTLDTRALAQSLAGEQPQVIEGVLRALEAWESGESRVAGGVALSDGKSLTAGEAGSAHNFARASTTVAQTIRDQGRKQPVDLSTNSWGGERQGGGWNSPRNMSNNAVAALDAGKLMERDLPAWVADRLDIPPAVVTQRAIRLANIDAQNIYPEYHHVAERVENFYDPEDLLKQPKFWLGIRGQLKTAAHRVQAGKQAVQAVQAVRQELIGSGELGSWSSVKPQEMATSALMLLEPKWRAQVEAGDIDFREGSIADYNARLQDWQRRLDFERKYSEPGSKKEGIHKERLAAVEREMNRHPATRFMEKATAGASAVAGQKIQNPSSADAPGGAGLARQSSSSGLSEDSGAERGTDTLAAERVNENLTAGEPVPKHIAEMNASELDAEAERLGISLKIETVKEMMRGDAGVIAAVRARLAADDRVKGEAPTATGEAGKLKPLNPGEAGGLDLSGPRDAIVRTYARAATGLQRRAAGQDIKGGFDAITNIANQRGQQVTRALRLGVPDATDIQAMPFVIEAGGDPAKLKVMRDQVATSVDPKLAKQYLPFAEHALANAGRLHGLRDRHDGIMRMNMDRGEADGIHTNERENYVSLLIAQPTKDNEVTPAPLFDMGAGNRPPGSLYFAKNRSYDTLAEAIHDGMNPKTSDLAVIDGHRTTALEGIIQQKRFLDGLKKTTVPGTKLPVIGEKEKVPQHKVETNSELAARQAESDRAHAASSATDPQSRMPDITPEAAPKLTRKVEETEKLVTPDGYEEISGVKDADGNDIVVHKQFAGLFRSLYQGSALRDDAAWRAAIKVNAIGKHGTLIGDFRHAFRGLYKMMMGGGGLPVTLRGGKPAWNVHKGLAVLEIAPEFVDEAVANGEITATEGRYIVANAPYVKRLIAAGQMTGQSADNLMAHIQTHIPIVTATNRWIFSTIFRGAQIQTGIAWLKRNDRNPRFKTPQEAATAAAKEVNDYFGNLGTRGFLASKTLQDLAQLIILAPRWSWGMLRHEARAWSGIVRAIPDSIRAGRPMVPNNTLALAAGMAAMFVAVQVLSQLFRKKFTWQNKEEHRQMAAWIPDAGDPEGRGFWLDPFKMNSEFVHDAMKYTAQHEDLGDIALHIAQNKLSTLGRGGVDLGTGRDFSNRPFHSWKDRIRAALIDTLPSPMPLSGVIEKNPRGAGGEGPITGWQDAADKVLSYVGYRLNRQPAAGQKQLASMANFDLERAASARTQMFSIAQPFRADKAHHDSAGDFTELRKALDTHNDRAVQGEVAFLLTQGKTIDDMQRAVGLAALPPSWKALAAEDPEAVKPLKVRLETFAGTGLAESEMLKAIKDNPARMALYQQAQAEHEANARHFFDVLHTPETAGIVNYVIDHLPEDLKAQQEKVAEWKKLKPAKKNAARNEAMLPKTPEAARNPLLGPPVPALPAKPKLQTTWGGKR